MSLDPLRSWRLGPRNKSSFSLPRFRVLRRHVCRRGSLVGAVGRVEGAFPFGLERGVRLSQPAEPSTGYPGKAPRALLVGALPGEGWVLSGWLKDVVPGDAPLDLIEVDSLEAALDVAQHERLEFCFFGTNLGPTALLRFLRQSRSIPHVVPVIVLAARADEDTVVEALREGAHDF